MALSRVSFAAGPTGEWSIETLQVVRGQSLPSAARLTRLEGDVFQFPSGSVWVIDGVRSNDRYVTRAEKDQLVARQAEIGRTESGCAALIPIKKSEAWWKLTQDERRSIFEDHTAIGLEYLPAIARRLYHCRDLGSQWDFLTWFEFADSERAAFDDLVARLRATEEWRYVESEVDIRVTRP